MTNYNVARGHGLKKVYLIDLFFLIETSHWKKKLGSKRRRQFHGIEWNGCLLKFNPFLSVYTWTDTNGNHLKLLFVNYFLSYYAEMPLASGQDGNLGVQLTAFQPLGADYVHHISAYPLGFENLTASLLWYNVS